MNGRWWGLVLYPAALVAVFLGVQLLLGMGGVAPGQRAALAALPAVAALLLSLPAWVRRRWRTEQPWRALGLAAAPRQALGAVAAGSGTAAVLLALVVAGLALAGQLSWRQAAPAPALLINGLVLGAGVGFAEELLFRGWLLGELERLIGRGPAWLAQALVFSLVHLRTTLQPPQHAGLLGGLLLLGLALGQQRRGKGGLWGAIGLHGALVGGWFVISQGLVSVAAGAPVWLAGPANPIGGLLGWLGLAALLVLRERRP